MKNYRYVLFDLDGTLTESGEGIINSAVYALKKFGIEPEMSTMTKFLGPPLKDSFRDFYGFDDEKCEQAVKYYREYYTTKGIFENRVYDGVEECLKKLSEAGLHLAVATSKPQVFAVKILEHFHLAQYFDYIGGAELDGSRSVKADVIVHTLKNCGVNDCSQVIMAGAFEGRCGVYSRNASGSRKMASGINLTGVQKSENLLQKSNVYDIIK